MNTKNLAIMSTDIVGSTGTTASLKRKEYDVFRSKYDQLVKQLIENASGEIFKSLGDGYLASFESSTNAVLAGLNIQSQLKSSITTLLLDQRFATRIGISSGDVNIDRGDRFGIPVILATRVQTIAEPLATYFTESVFLTMNRNEILYDDLGYISLKGLEDKVRVFRAWPKERDSRSEELAVLCTDIKAGTALLETGKLEELERMLVAYDEVVFKHAFQHKGFFRYNVGDMYLITFERAEDAFEAAASMMGAFRELKDRHAILSNDYQFGLDFGHVKQILGRLYGFSFSRIAPLLAQNSKGEIVVSGAFWERLKGENPSRAAELRVSSLGQARVKGLAKPVEMYAFVL